MNCIEAQVLLATYRELKNGEVDIAELDVHLEECSSCRQVLAGYSFIGEQVRSLPPLEPSPHMHTKLMKALAVEYTQFIQHSSTVTSPTPEFLKPYLREHMPSSHKTDSLTTFSSADTGPLPVLHSPHKKRRRTQIGQFAAIGIAAAFFMALMMGGLTSLLLLAHNHVAGGSGVTSIEHPIDVTSATYKTTTLYRHVVSAVADRTSIYYTAYGDSNSDGWMLEQLGRTTNISTPLLTTASTSPLIALGSANGRLVWLQLDTSKITTQTLPHRELRTRLQTWSLHSLSLLPQQQNGITVPNEPTTIVSGTFNLDAAPGWVYTPVQGIWFVQNTVLVAMIDDHSISHLMQYPLDPQSIFARTEIAKASPGHIFTSPTANSDGSQIYWAEEWRTDDNNLHSNIWTQQVFDNPHPTIKHLAQETSTEKDLFLQDGMSFRPVVVDETLFLLSTASSMNVTQVTPGTTPKVIPTTTPVPTATPDTNASTVPWADTNFYMPPLDSKVRGTLLMFPLGSAPDASPTPLSSVGSASALQAGMDFVFWQNDDNTYGMYDAAAKTNINVGDILTGAQFLAVNGNTAVWTVNNAQDTTTATTATTATGAGQFATLMAFNWPRK
ncbi:MAG: anti-sigma factor family protein [Ktedonobacteraceae bacterium]